MPFIPALGQSDFRKLREAGAGYVDKTDFIRQIIAEPTEVILFPRPRRFGKTLFVSTLSYFLEKRDEDLSHLFRDLAVWNDPVARAHFQQHPVLFLTFKDVKTMLYEDTLESIALEIRALYRKHRYLLEQGALGPDQTLAFERILSGEATPVELSHSLRMLSELVANHHGRKVVIVIDEYDTPIQSGYLNGFFDAVTQFYRNFFSAALKDNTSLFKGVLTGILRVARENMFSGLNNVIVYSLLKPKYATAFGFTEAEVAAIIEPEHLEEARSWYNGYLFGGHVIYNPWSILNYIKSGTFAPYWVNTSSNDLLAFLITRRGVGLSATSEALLRGETIEARIAEDIVLRDIDQQPDALWNFLMFAGYLKPVALHDNLGEVTASLGIPNLEVRVVYRDLFRSWLLRGLPQRQYIDDLVKALLTGDARTVEAIFERLLLTVLSYQDPAGREPEKLYHGFVLGLLVHMENEYDVRSNRESGYGRADVLLRPKTKGKPGVVMELKVPYRDETPEQALLAAAEQVRERRYAAELTAAGATPVQEFVMLFDGKRAWVRRVSDMLGA